ncbi:hypothetical protein ACFJI0_20915 [Hydrogenophaga sp. UC242_53]|uniref:hypothetical protein n=1 Tax=Hydrogenophaga sp. UC242_53 TaxID=3350170 RepID=UPI0036D33B7E
MSTPTLEPSSADTGASAAPVAGPLAREAIALAAFDHVVAHAPGYRARPGQREMAAHIAHTLSGVTLGDGAVASDAALPARGIAVVQAGTGVGKSAAYASTVIPLALAQQKRVIISTATVALQEQLIAKDLPALAATLPQPFSFALAKGRGRYVCRLKLDQLSGGDAASADLFESDDGGGDPSAAGMAAQAVASAAAAARWQERGVQYTAWANALDGGSWDGDRDRLDDPPDGSLWAPVAAERHTCTARHCPSYNSCSYYQARAKLAQAQVIVVNHDLLLSTLGLHALPAPQDCYLVFDEAHHLGSVAQGQFTASMDLMRCALAGQAAARGGRGAHRDRPQAHHRCGRVHQGTQERPDRAGAARDAAHRLAAGLAGPHRPVRRPLARARRWRFFQRRRRAGGGPFRRRRAAGGVAGGGGQAARQRQQPAEGVRGAGAPSSRPMRARTRATRRAAPSSTAAWACSRRACRARRKPPATGSRRRATGSRPWPSGWRPV